MNAKEYLEQLGNYKNTISELEEFREELKESLHSLRSAKTDMERTDRTKNSDTILKQIIKLQDIQRETNDLRMEYMKKKIQVIKEITSVKDPKLNRLLTLRYMKNMPLAKIAEEMGFTEDHIRHMHRKALLAFTEIVSNKK